MLARSALTRGLSYRYSALKTTALAISKPNCLITTVGTGSLRGFSSSFRTRSDNMCPEDAFREMEANGVPKQGQPTAAAAPEQEQQEELPKLSAAEFKIYNRMAEHMDMFVRIPRSSPRLPAKAIAAS